MAQTQKERLTKLAQTAEIGKFRWAVAYEEASIGECLTRRDLAYLLLSPYKPLEEATPKELTERVLSGVWNKKTEEKDLKAILDRLEQTIADNS